MTHDQRIHLEILIEDAIDAALNLDNATHRNKIAAAKLHTFLKELEDAPTNDRKQKTDG